ncbi:MULTISPECIES: PLP-dependent aspartate aminotransferase family protein [Snodgrassella]|uniref:PLP-dependent aspartate aminotransferase family protein n=1 Tax=Snodgrassella alvi TaxID=1196083 RepID=A0ABD7Z3D6_9NEIS|nr:MULTISPECIES: PLP-dependent aspartate aminotransferase family protein [Snodgrassella]AHN27735.1 carbon-sulfur lyase [Snodgrassella alvi wkB2]MBI0098434.1 PLP-dependent transferase [Snodgrassella sp. W8134]MBI0102224.1 PLP-dependent transferase [Snodgrassella sp. W8135]MBI0130093.1 PLP-dependent transferase [Snodgrassella sp. W8124]MBI0133610.1 PLP-dependent transferase [Snodgrassella sp. W8132]
MKFATQTIHSSYQPEEHNRALMPPIYQNSMFAMNEIGENIPFRYARISNPTRQVLEDTVAELENGCAGFAYGSGMAGIDAVWRTFLRPGDTIVAVADIYGGAYDLLTEVYAQWGVNVIFADLTNPDNLDRILAQTKVKMVWLETPSNPLLRLVDIAELSAKAKAAGAIVGMDNTFATPYVQNPLNLGVDIVFHSATKYLCGHSDVLMGIVVVKDPAHAKLLRALSINTGGVAGPMDCALVLRGIKTLVVRMDRHLSNAAELARRLQQHPAVEKVFYPGLAEHEHHDIACKQMQHGFGGVVSIYLRQNSREAANSVIKNLRMIRMAASLGGVESLINHSASQSHSGMSKEVKESLGIREGLLRISAGIEDIEDIWDDINHALNTLI